MLLSLPLALLSERRPASGLAGTPVAQVYRRDFGAHLITGVARCMTTHRGWPPQHRAGVFLGERAGPDFYGRPFRFLVNAFFDFQTCEAGLLGTALPPSGPTWFPVGAHPMLSSGGPCRDCSSHILGMTRIRRVVTDDRPRAEPPGTLAKTVRNP